MPALKKLTRNRRIKLRNGKVYPLRARPEPAASVYFGVQFKDGVGVFMPRRAGMPDRDFNKLRAYALSVRGLDAKHEAEITVTAEACNNCARSIPGCAGCDFSRALAVAKAEGE